MRSNNASIFLLISFVFLSVVAFPKTSRGYNWPVSDTAAQHRIVGTVGEWRSELQQGEGIRFHRGVDITNPDTKDVYTIDSGTVEWGGSKADEYIKVGNKRYIHIDRIISKGVYVTAGTRIGTIKSGPAHLHFQVANSNPLNNGLQPFDDNTAPTINAYSFRVNGHNFTTYQPRLQANRLYGKIDIVANIDDTRLNASGNNDGRAVAPYQIRYRILSSTGTEIDNIDYLTFDSYPTDTNANQIFGVGSTQSNFNWIITNHPFTKPIDRYWNTKLRKGVIEDWSGNPNLDARINSEAVYADGRYTVRITARDIDNNATYNSATKDIQVIIDNFKQTIHAVERGTNYELDVFYTKDVNPVVYVRGSEYVANRSYTLYVTENQGWEDGDTIDQIKRTVTVSTNAQGEINPQQIYPNAPQGDYDIIVDYDGDGRYTEGLDAVDGLAGPSSPYGAGFRVVPGKRIRVPLLVFDGQKSFKPPAGTWALVTIKRPGFPREEAHYSNLVVNEDGEIQFDGDVGEKIAYRVFLKTFTRINPQFGTGDAKAGVLTEPTSPAFYVMASPLFGIKPSGNFYIPDADVVTFVDGWSETLVDEQFRLPALFTLLTIPVNSMLEGNLGYFIYGTMQRVTIRNRAAPFRLLDNLAWAYDVARQQLPDEEISPAIAIWASKIDYTPDGVSCYWQKTPGNENYKVLIAPQDANNQDKVFQAYADMLFVRHGKRPTRPSQSPAKMLASINEASLAQYLIEQESPGGMIRLNPSPEERTTPAQAFLNGFCYYFSAVVRESPVVSVGRKAYNLETLTAQGIDNELAVAAMLWAIRSPTTVLNAIYQPRQDIPNELVYNVCDLFSELENQGMDLTGLYVSYGLKPEVIEVTDQDTTRPTFIWSDNGILANPDTYTLEIAADSEFNDIVDTFPGLRETTYSLTTTELDNGLYYWRVKVENPNLPDLYSDFGVVEVVSTSSGRDHFHVEGISDPIEVNEESGMTVYIHDAGHNIKTNYVGTIHFSSSDTLAALPADYTFTLANVGSYTFTGGIIFRTSGEQEAQVNDLSNPEIMGSQKKITVLPENFAPQVTVILPITGAIWSGTKTVQWQTTDANVGDTILIGLSYTSDRGIILSAVINSDFANRL